MESRWAVLTVRACRLAALDYSKISRLDPASLVKERLVLLDIEREMLASQCVDLARVWSSDGTPAGREAGKRLVDLSASLLMPWSKPALEKAQPQQLLALYDRLINKKKRG